MLRKIWNKYFSECHGIVFVIDGSDEIRFKEVKETLDDIFEEDSDIEQLPVMFLLNKMDKGEFRGVDFISDRLQLQDVRCSGESVILPISAVE